MHNNLFRKHKLLLALGFLSMNVWTASLYAEGTTNTEATPKAAEAAPATSAQDPVIATVNGTNITRSMLDTVMEMVKNSGAGNEQQIDEKSVLDDLIATELARQEAKKSGIAEQEDIKVKVKDFTDKLVLNTWMKEKASSFKFTDEELKAAYDKRMEGTPKSEYKARHILVKSKEEADANIKELNEKKTDFAELAKQKSTGPSAPTGGDLGWFKPNSMVAPFAEAVSKMSPGDISKEPVQTQFGWHIIKLEEKRDVELPDFEKIKPQLQRLLEQEKMINYMRTLRDGADVKIMLPDAPVKEADSEEKKDEPTTTTAEPAKTQ